MWWWNSLLGHAVASVARWRLFMRANRHETYGVFLGWSIPCMGGFLYMVKGRVTWGWGYYPNEVWQ
jgi:hypothetical protein